MARRRDRLDDQPAGFERTGDDRQPELVLVLDVVEMTVCPQHVRRRQPLLFDEREQRLERRAGVDEDSCASGLVADDVRVREKAGIHASADQHGRYASGTNLLQEDTCQA